jgi:tetratricopeptide (TPR) repeat protein
MNKKMDICHVQNCTEGHFYFYNFFIITIMLFLICGCSHEKALLKTELQSANNSFIQGDYDSSLNKYLQIVNNHPASDVDRVLFEIGIIYSHPGNKQKDYEKALECFQKLIKEYPESSFRHDSEMMVFYINNVIVKDKTIAALQTQIEALRHEVKDKEKETDALQAKVETLEQDLKNKENEILKLQKEIFISQQGLADKIVIEKKERRMILFAKDNVLKTYKISLGENPVGPKGRQGDKKTPEGIYCIDSRNRNSHYHLALHISYPNEKDKERAGAVGVSPGGDIMIHGLKDEFAWVGDFQSDFDWTDGCIAVTNEEIEEIDRLVPDGTVVEIRP